MSEPVQQQQASEEEPQEFIDLNEVAQEVEVNDDGMAPPEDDDDEDAVQVNADEIDPEQDADGDDMMGETIEIDMANNSIAYFDKHTDSIFCIAHHPTLPLVVTGGGDNIAHLWTSHTQPPRYAGVLEGHKESVISVSFTSDGKYLVSADMSGNVLIHEGQKGGASWVKVGELSEVEEVVWLETHPTVSGIFAFGATDGSVWAYQIENGAPGLLMSGFIHTEESTKGVFVNTQDQNVCELITIAQDSKIVKWNCYTGESMFKIRGEDVGLQGTHMPWVSLSYNKGEFIAVGSSNGVAAILRASDGAVMHATQFFQPKDEDDMDASIETISWSENFALLAIGNVGGYVVLLQTTNWAVRHKFELGDAVTKVLFDENELFASCISGKVHVFDARNGQEKFVCLGHNMGVMDFLIDKRDDKRRVITAGDEGVSLVFDVVV